MGPGLSLKVRVTSAMNEQVKAKQNLRENDPSTGTISVASAMSARTSSALDGRIFAGA
jgi:hypothetical protein